MKMAAAGMLCVATVAAGATAGEVVVRDGERAWRFAEVDGTSQLPLEYMQTGEGREKREDHTLKRYWIAEEMVTEGDFAAVMGRPLREGLGATNAVTTIEWAEAREFCERFTKKYAPQFPKNCIASIPTMREWAHAVRVLDGKTDLYGETGTFLFTGIGNGGFLYTLYRDDARKHDPDENIAWDFVIVPKRMKLDRLGLRLVLVDVSGEMTADYHPVVIRGMVAMQAGFFEAAQGYFSLAVARGNLETNLFAEVKRGLDFCRQGYGEVWEDWSGLVSSASAHAARRGCAVEPFAPGWQAKGFGDEEDAHTAAEYEKCGISGRWIRIGDLSPEIRAEQPVGEKRSVAVEADGSVDMGEFAVTTNTLVQALACDFSGDGTNDLVVESFGNVGSGGYWYAFYMRLPGGGYTNVHDVQTVGLCAFPRRDGRGCGFVVVEKKSNPALAADFLTFDGGKPYYERADMRPFYMLDAKEDQLYLPAPFIGAGYGLGWRHLESRGTWYRPLYWPWKAGTIQGLEEARADVDRQRREKAAAKERLAALRAKWPHAGDRVSMWEMPNHAKRFFEIDRYQRNEWKNGDRASNEKMEALCREAVALKIEPNIWHYNLACALALQGKRDEAFGALEQSVAAGYYDGEHAKEDDDLASLRGDARFAGLLELMAMQDLTGMGWPKEQAVLTNGQVRLTAGTVHLAFNDKSYFAEITGELDSPMFYMDRDGKNGAQVEGFCSVAYDDEGVWHGRHKGLANVRIRLKGDSLPSVARGTFRPEEIRTDAFDAVETAKGNVLGLYSAEKYDARPNWCILYRGGETEGVALARLVREAFFAMPKDRLVVMLEIGGFAMTVTELVHRAMKDGRDGNVIGVDDIDRDKLLLLAAHGDVWFMAGDSDIVTIAVRMGLSPEELRQENGLGAGEEVPAETVLKLPRP